MLAGGLRPLSPAPAAAPAIAPAAASAAVLAAAPAAALDATMSDTVRAIAERSGMDAEAIAGMLSLDVAAVRASLAEQLRLQTAATAIETSDELSEREFRVF